MIPLQDHPEFPFDKKQKILADWLTFVRSGFDWDAYSEILHDYVFHRRLRDEHDPDTRGWYLNHRDNLRDFASREVFWQAHFSGDFINLYGTMHNLGRTALYPDRAENCLRRYPGVGDLDIAVSQMIASYAPLILESWQEREHEFIERTIEAEIDAALSSDPTLSRDDLENSGWMISIPEEQRQITVEVRARFAAALALRRRLIFQPALFNLKPGTRGIVKGFTGPGPAPGSRQENRLRPQNIGPNKASETPKQGAISSTNRRQSFRPIRQQRLTRDNSS